MPLSLKDLRPCAMCEGGLIEQGGMPVFHVVSSQIATIDEQALSGFLAMNQYFEGKAPKLAEMFSPGFDRGVLLEEEMPSGGRAPRRQFICHSCWLGLNPTKPPAEWKEDE